MSTRTLGQLQTSLPWTIKYSRDYRASPLPQKDFAHACHHASKAMGQLHGLVDEMEHDRELATDPALRDRYGKYIADLVVSALRMANTFPGGAIDLEGAVIARIETKNGVTLRRAVAIADSITQLGHGAGI
jgi:hypothetical protein